MSASWRRGPAQVKPECWQFTGVADLHGASKHTTNKGLAQAVPAAHQAVYTCSKESANSGARRHARQAPGLHHDISQEQAEASVNTPVGAVVNPVGQGAQASSEPPREYVPCAHRAHGEPP